jgi:gluconate 2-dehydrogenase gamma chain
MRRRAFMMIPLAALSAPLVRMLGAESLGVDFSRDMLLENGSAGADGNAMVRVPLRFFTESEAKIVTAATERIFPRDASGAGATDAAVTVYIDRQLAGPYGRDKYRYTKAPFGDSSPEHGYQGAATPRQVYRDGLRGLAGFVALSEPEQIAALTAIEHSHFFTLLRAHTIEGMFCDPSHGGNAKLVGWKLVGFPGPRMNNRADIDAHHGQSWRPAPASLEQVTGHKPAPWEDERGGS